MGEEERFEGLGQEGIRSQGKMIQFPVLNIVGFRNVADVDTLDLFVNLVKGA